MRSKHIRTTTPAPAPTARGRVPPGGLRSRPQQAGAEGPARTSKSRRPGSCQRSAAGAEAAAGTHLSISPCPTRKPMLSSLVVQRPFSCKTQGAAAALPRPLPGVSQGRPPPHSPLRPARRRGTAPPPSRCAAAGTAPRPPSPLRSGAPRQRPAARRRPAPSAPGPSAAGAPAQAAAVGLVLAGGKPRSVPARRRLPEPLRGRGRAFGAIAFRARCLGRRREWEPHKRAPPGGPRGAQRWGQTFPAELRTQLLTAEIGRGERYCPQNVTGSSPAAGLAAASTQTRHRLRAAGGRGQTPGAAETPGARDDREDPATPPLPARRPARQPPVTSQLTGCPGAAVSVVELWLVPPKPPACERVGAIDSEAAGWVPGGWG